MSNSSAFKSGGSASRGGDDGKHFKVFSDYLEKACAIVLGPNKQYLVQSRLKKILEEERFANLSELVDKLKIAPRSSLRTRVLDAMTTNETLWFRDNYPYEILKKRLLPELAKRPASDRLRIWSAACSSGQEPYSISMAIEEFQRSNPGVLRNQVRVLATDLSDQILQDARRGVYDRLALGRGLSDERLKLFFDEQPNGSWAVKSPIRSRVEFRPINLMESYALLGRFDIVFCRNVLIYFSGEMKRDILTRIHGTLKPGGCLFVGGSESVSGLNELYDMVHCTPGIMYIAKEQQRRR